MGLQVVMPLLLVLGLSSAQRGSYAGKRPIGYPAITTTTTAAGGLVDRFGEDGVTSTTARLPPEALGDRELVDRISKLPVDKQPFWYLNWQALEANRNKPQYTDPNRPSFVNQFVESNAQTLGSRFGDETQQPGASSSNVQTGTSLTIPNRGNIQASAFSEGTNVGGFGGINAQVQNDNGGFVGNGQPGSGNIAQSTLTRENFNSRNSASVHTRDNRFRHRMTHHHQDFRPSLHGEGFSIHTRQ